MPLPDEFEFDVFLSHSSKDKAVVTAIAEQLRKDGLRIWFDAWQIKPGDNIPAAIEHGLDKSRVLVLCMSANAFGSDWAQLEAGIYRFRDPLNKDRRFIPLRLDAAPIKGSLAQFLYVDWTKNREQAYATLVEACQQLPTAVMSRTMSHPVKANDALSSQFSSDRTRLLTGNGNGTLRLWDVKSGKRVRTFRGHTSPVWSVVWSTDQRRALSSAYDGVLIWNLKTGLSERRLEGNGFERAAWSSDQRFIISGSKDSTLRLWDSETGKCLRVFGERDTASRSFGAVAVAFGTDSRRILAGYRDKTIRL